MSRALVALMALALLLGCEREQRRFSELAPASSAPEPARQTVLQPGTPRTSPATPITTRQMATRPTGLGPYDTNAWAIAEGKQLFNQYNCNGCHANGGGGMGPPLMDAGWRYGHEPEQIFATIVEGRPNGMPSFGGKLPAQQVWQLVAYVRSMSGLLRKDVRPGRGDHMRTAPPEQQHAPERPRREEPPK
jgi:cytochrome c oxidase cbb3-type subunit 3